MSIYDGQVAGIQYEDSLRREREADQMKREALVAGLRNTALERQGAALNQLAAKQYEPMGGFESEKEALGPAAGPAPAVTALPLTPKKTEAETEGLPEMIRLAAMGNPRRAESAFNSSGKMKIVPGSLKYAPDGSVSWTDAETGETPVVGKQHVDAIVGGYKEKPELIQDPLKKEALETTIKKNKQAIDLAAKEEERKANPVQKGLSARDEIELERQNLEIQRKYRDEVKKHSDAILKQEKELADILQQSKIAADENTPDIYAGKMVKAGILKENIKTHKDALLDLQKAPPDLNLPQRRTAIPERIQYEGRAQIPVAALPIAPPPAPAPAPAVAPQPPKVDDNHAKYNFLDSALKTGIHPNTGQKLTAAQTMLVKEKMKELKNAMLGNE